MLLAPEVGLIEGVTRIVLYIVDTPAGPEDTLADTEVNGVGVDSALAVAVGPLEPADVPPVAEAVLPLPEPVPLARPVILESVGTEDAVLPPIVAYALPSCKAKNGRATGDSLQQLTCCASALQHQSLL